MKKGLITVLAVVVGCILATGAWSLESQGMQMNDAQLILAGKGFGGGADGPNDGTGDNGGVGPGDGTGDGPGGECSA